MVGRIFADWYIYADQRLTNAQRELGTYKKVIKLKDDHINNLENQLDRIKNSLAWKIAKRLKSAQTRITKR